MSFLETVEKARAFLERNGRVSLSALRLEFGLDEAQMSAIGTKEIPTADNRITTVTTKLRDDWLPG